MRTYRASWSRITRENCCKLLRKIPQIYRLNLCVAMRCVYMHVCGAAAEAAVEAAQACTQFK